MTKPTSQELKQQMIAYLKTQECTDVTQLWNAGKDWAEQKGYTMGGSYFSFATDISANLMVDGELHRFRIDLSEVK